MACAINLKKFNIDVIQALNGYMAVQKVKESIQDNLRIDFILLDLNMPILDGYDACSQIVKLFDLKSNGIFPKEIPNLRKSSHISGASFGLMDIILEHFDYK